MKCRRNNKPAANDAVARWKKEEEKEEVTLSSQASRALWSQATTETCS
jgi:hypothetical protein